jgi:hypothetical protein
MDADEVFEFGYRHGRQVKHFLIDVLAHGYENLRRVLGVAFSDIVVGELELRATHFVADGERKQLTLLGGTPGLEPLSPTGAEAFSAPLTADEVARFAWDWLQKVKYPPDDEHDGGSVKGWRAYNQQFGIVDGRWEALVAIKPMWVYLSK